MLRRAGNSLAACHLLGAIAVLCALRRAWRPVGLLCLVIGLGGTGAAWGKHTDEADLWLRLAGAHHRPERPSLRCAAQHVPFALAGAGIYWHLTRHTKGSPAAESLS